MVRHFRNCINLFSLLSSKGQGAELGCEITLVKWLNLIATTSTFILRPTLGQTAAIEKAVKSEVSLNQDHRFAYQHRLSQKQHRRLQVG